LAGKILRSQQVTEVTTCVVVRQQHAVVETVTRFHIERALQIRVYKSEWVVRARKAPDVRPSAYLACEASST
jgi:hypothetical protein